MRELWLSYNLVATSVTEWRESAPAEESLFETQGHGVGQPYLNV
jgi:hypothetical protein